MADTDSPVLVEVRITTKTGAKYVFPDVPRAGIESPIGPTSSAPSLQLVNISVAVLSLPWMIVSKVELYSPDNREVIWVSNV